MGVLPGGYWDTAGRLHREFELATLTGREEELLADARSPRPAALVTEVLSRCLARLGDISPVPPEVVRQLLVADRQYLLLRLRRATFGDRVGANLICPWPDCGRRVSIQFSVDSVPVEEARDRAPTHTTTTSDGTEIVFRLPTGADQEELSDHLAVNEAGTLTALLARCVLRIGPQDGPPDHETVAALPAAVRAEIEQAMRERAPSVEQTLEAECAECGRSFLAPFDVHRFFFGELRTDAAALYQEVHYLAYHYHWSETEIMAMTRGKRHTYIDVLADAIEVLNSGT
ncbi:T4 family baseplate hub assembly chaperone [Streptomyces sp. NPDC001443]